MKSIILNDFFKCLNEKGMLCARLKEFFDEISDFEAVENIDWIINKAYKRDIIFQKILLILGDSLGRERCFGRERCIYIRDIAREFECTKVLWIFTDEARMPSLVDEDTPSFPELDEFSLGHKKFYARQFDRRLLEKLSYDRNPEVIRELLNNALLTEREIVKIAARRNISPEILKEIYRHEKWISRYSIKAALLWNPHTPVSISIALIPHLLIQDIKPILHHSGFHPYIKDAIKFYIEMREGSPHR
jgi:hypothetical protein